jgi:hypothetical protein
MLETVIRLDTDYQCSELSMLVIDQYVVITSKKKVLKNMC